MSGESRRSQGPARAARARRFWLLLVVVIAGLSYYAWTALTRPRGAQTIGFAASTQTCATSGDLRYCVHRAQAGSNGDILYHLHGRNLDEQVWNDDTFYTGMLQAEWQRRGVVPPTVVTVSYGPVWLLAPKGTEPKSGLLDDFLTRLPAIEREIGVPRRRMLLGESMGGLNVLVAGLTAPVQFAKVAALCPGVYAVSPFAPVEEIRAAAVRTGADPRILFGLWMLARQYLSNEAEWQRFSPLALIERADSTYPALYLSNGLYDRYGNFEGTSALARAAEARGVSTEWRPLYGGHCAVDAPSVAAFLVP